MVVSSSLFSSLVASVELSVTGSLLVASEGFIVIVVVFVGFLVVVSV